MALRAECSDSCLGAEGVGAEPAGPALALSHLRPGDTLLITALVVMGNEGNTGVVFNNLYVDVDFEPIYFTHGNSEVFLNAYAIAVGRVVAFDENLLPKLKKSAEEIYFTLIANGNLDKITEVMALCSVIIIYAGIDKELGDENIAALNGVSYEEIEKIITLIENK